MPELPEVETVRRSLLPYIVGKEISSVTPHHPKTIRHSPHLTEALIGQSFTALDRIAKLLIFPLSSGDSLITHLKMTGQFFYDNGQSVTGGGHSMTGENITAQTKSPLPTLPPFPHRHTRLSLGFTDGTALHFNDMRLFGYVRLVSPSQLTPIVQGYGPEVGTPALTHDYFTTTVRGRRAPLKGILLNQKLMAGLGNIYVDEACHRARVRPDRRGQTLTLAEAHALHAACQQVIRDAIAVGGTTFQYYADALGRSGGYVDQLQVFRRDGSPCFACGQLIVKTKCAGRGTHFCPACQQ